jgi:hypothetical protein
MMVLREIGVECSAKIAMPALPRRRRTLRLFQRSDRRQRKFFRADIGFHRSA